MSNAQAICQTSNRILIYTSRVDSRLQDVAGQQGIVFFDITRKSGGSYTPPALAAIGGSGLHFAPSRELLAAAKGWRRSPPISSDQYVDRYLAQMRLSYQRHRRSWDWLLAQPAVALACYCDWSACCHRYLLAGILKKVAAARSLRVLLAGELLPPARMRQMSFLPTTEGVLI